MWTGDPPCTNEIIYKKKKFTAGVVDTGGVA